MKSKINFRTVKPQVVNLPWEGEVTITFAGICPLTGIRLYESSGGNDPRGPLGEHAVHEFVASEYNMTGPSVNASWIAVNNDSTAYSRALEIAKRKWK